MKLIAALALCLATVSCAFAQIHPPVGNARYNESNAFVFRDGELTTIRVTMNPSDLDTMLANPWNEVEYPCTMRFTNAVTDETMQNVTIKIRGATARNAMKKSFRLSFNSIVSGTRFHGIKKLNIIGAQNDVSVIRTKLALDQLRTFGLPSQRAALAHFLINDGRRANDIYIATEQINDDFLKAWFGNDTGNLYKGTYQGARADLRFVWPGDAATYQNYGNGQTYVEENNEETPDFTDLADLIRFINQSTSQEFYEGLPARFNVDGFLRNMAADVVLGGWDNIWYGSNNWFMYHNPSTGRFEWIPYDYDNSFGVDFFGVDWALRPVNVWGSGGFGSNPDISPLVRRVLAFPSWVAQFRRYIHEFVGSTADPLADGTEAPFSLAAMEGKIDLLKELAQPYAFQGPTSGPTMDWNWTPADFAASFDTPTIYQRPGRPWNWGVKPYISTRSAYLRATVSAVPPLAGVYVNEVLPVNSAVNADESGAFDEWVELYNSQDTAVDVGGMYLSNSSLNVRRWRIPDGTIIAAKGFLLVWADNQPEQGTDHAGFTLSAGGQTVGLYDRDANSNLLINSLSVPESFANVSYGRFPDAAKTVMPFQHVTPRAPNSLTRPYTWDDALLALRVAGGLEAADGEGVDANGDAVVDAGDAALILRRLSGL